MRADAPDLDGGIGIAGPSELGDLRRFSHEAMNTVFEVYAAHADARYAAQAAQAAFALVDRLEGELSRFRSNSDISRLNHLTAGESARVGEAALECLLIARHLYDVTDGAFDVAIGTGLPSLEIDADDFLIRATAGRRSRRSRRHRQGLRGGSDGGTARGVGPRPRVRPRRLQLRPRTRVAGGLRRMAADAQRSRRAIAGLRPALDAPDSAQRVRRTQGRPHPGPAHRRAGARAARSLGRAPPASQFRRRRRQRGPQARACRCRGRVDDRLHGAERRPGRRLVRAQSRPRGVGAP